jgi:hypothetical protein
MVSISLTCCGVGPGSLIAFTDADRRVVSKLKPVVASFRVI